MASKERKIEFVQGQDAIALIQATSFERFAQVLGEATFNPPEDRDAIYVQEKINEHVQGVLEKIRLQAADGNTIIVTVDGVPAATCSYKKMLSKFHDGRDVYEIDAGVTLPEPQFKGLRLTQKAQQFIFEKIRRDFPDAPITITTKHPFVKSWLTGWHKGGANDKLRILRSNITFTEDELRTREEEWIRHNWEFFWFDPLEKNSN